VDGPAVEINVTPAKGEKLAAPHAGAHRDRDDRLKWPLLRCLEQHPYLIRVQDRHFSSADTWRADQVSDVARHEVPAHRLAERRVERRVEVMHRRRTEAGTEAALVETRQVLWRQPAHLHVADDGHDVDADVLLATAPGRRAQLGSSPLKPGGKERCDRLLAAGQWQATAELLSERSKLVGDFGPGLPMDVAPLSVHPGRVGRPASVRALDDRPLTLPSSSWHPVRMRARRIGCQ
jgi:hypothetical protein